MAHFAQIDNTNTVTRVLVVPDDQEHRGQQFLADDLGLGGTWVQTSYNHNIRKQFAGIGYTYNPTADLFISPSPYPSWVIDDQFDWQPPIPKPDGNYVWDEDSQAWVEVPDA
jgi:hypothetical protein